MQVYIYQADIYCGDCGLGMLDTWEGRPSDYEDSDYYPQGPYPNGGGEADSPQHCGNCGIFLENPLTSDGDEYVKESLENPGDFAVLAEWKAFYDYL